LEQKRKHGGVHLWAQRRVGDIETISEASEVVHQVAPVWHSERFPAGAAQRFGALAPVVLVLQGDSAWITPELHQHFGDIFGPAPAEHPGPQVVIAGRRVCRLVAADRIEYRATKRDR